MNIVEALATLDPKNDEQWTADGLPRMDVVEGLVGDKSITRADVTNAQPDFTREAAAASNDELPDAPEPDANAGLDTSEGEPDADADEEVIPGPDMSADEEAVPTPKPEADAEPVAESMSAMKLKELNIPSMDDLYKMSPADLEKERERFTHEMLAAQHAQEEVKKVSDVLANTVNSFNRRIDMLQKADPNHGTAGVRAYIKQQNANRMERAKGLHKFREMTGVDPKDVALATDPKAPIDRAMGARKPARGTARPDR